MKPTKRGPLIPAFEMAAGRTTPTMAAHDWRQRLLPAAECRTSVVCMFRPPPLFGDAFEIRAALRNVEPTVWRSVSVPVHLSLGDLHEILQVAFGWQNSHLHDFVVGEARFGMTDVEDE